MNKPNRQTLHITPRTALLFHWENIMSKNHRKHWVTIAVCSGVICLCLILLTLPQTQPIATSESKNTVNTPGRETASAP